MKNGLLTAVGIVALIGVCSAETASMRCSTRESGCDGFKPVLVVKAAENGHRRDAKISTNRVAGALAYSVRRSAIGNTWTEARVRPAVIVEVDNPTPIILSGETSVIRGIRASAVPSRYTRCSSKVGSPCVGAVSRRNGMVAA
jgi:hypothetical protein